MLQLLQLLRREMRPLAPLPFVLLVVLRLLNVGHAAAVVVAAVVAGAIVAGATAAGRCAAAGAIVMQAAGAAVAVGHLGFDGHFVQGAIGCFVLRVISVWLAYWYTGKGLLLTYLHSFGHDSDSASWPSGS